MLLMIILSITFLFIRNTLKMCCLQKNVPSVGQYHIVKAQGQESRTRAGYQKDSRSFFA